MFKRRPLPPPACQKCGGPTDFDVNVSSKAIEVYDTGRMTHQVEQIVGVADMLRERSKDAEREDPLPVKIGE